MMKKKSFFILILFGFLIFAQSSVFAAAGDLLRDKLKKVDVTGGLGKPPIVTVFEDTDPINYNKNINCDMEAFVLSDIPSTAILETDKGKYINSIIPGALYLESGDGAGYVSSHFYLDTGYKDAAGNWVPVKVGDSSDNDSSDPITSPKIYYSLDEETQFVSENFPVTTLDNIKADGYSCHDAENLCGSECIPPDGHCFGGKKPVIKNLRAKVKGIVPIETDSLIGEGSTVYFRIYYLDRTPPWIDGCSDNKFPTIGNDRKIFTGDWFAFDDLMIRENKDKQVDVKIVLGKIEHCPSSRLNWVDCENWDNGDVQTVILEGSGRKSGYLDDIFSSPPNNCYGYMRYTVFAQDMGRPSTSLGKRVGNLNPGCASIKEDRPNECYGLPRNAAYFSDLSRNPHGAKAWPYKENNNNVPNNERYKMTVKGITGDDRIHEGYIRISDNDLPNILIKLTSAKYGEEKQIFFPPCMPAGGLMVEDSPDFKNRSFSSFSADGLSNLAVYNEFVGDSRNILKECYYPEVKNSNKRPYFTIYDLVSSKHMNDRDRTQQSKLLKNADPSFINKHFRLEDQSYSDTRSDGKPDETLENNGESLLGKRNGTWKETIALIENLDDSEVEIQEDVEYELGVWVDDSVKWANSYPEEKNINNISNTIAIPTGIKEGKITIDIPNQVPPYHRVYEFPRTTYSTIPVVENSVQEPLKVVFREPTPDGEVRSVKELEENKFPSITVEASDFANNKRKIKLYFRVKDENAKIKTLQRKHQQY
ncbi:MAG: hypothetical protein IKO19_12575 [Candidatus Riflebacteria bacterium]|nr:hypothetical protein [Candidatus Riflebacteria bacterium]